MFKLEIETKNYAFADGAGYEVATILRNLADKIEDVESDKGSVFDSNGNRVGSYTLTTEED